jgi:hypothetical protein
MRDVAGKREHVAASKVIALAGDEDRDLAFQADSQKESDLTS